MPPFRSQSGDDTYDRRLGLFDHLSQHLPTPIVDPHTDDEITAYIQDDALTLLGELILPEVYDVDVPPPNVMADRLDVLVPFLVEMMASSMRPEHLREVLVMLGQTATPIEPTHGGGHPPLF